MPAPAFVVDASVVVRWLADGPFRAECRAFLRARSEINYAILSVRWG